MFSNIFSAYVSIFLLQNLDELKPMIRPGDGRIEYEDLMRSTPLWTAMALSGMQHRNIYNLADKLTSRKYREKT